MQALIPIGWQDNFGRGLEWLQRYVLLPSLIAQAVVIVLLLGAARSLAPRLRGACMSWADHTTAGPLHGIAYAVARVADWIAVLLALWFARLSFNAMGEPAPLLRLAESLVLVWVLIRLSSMLVRNEALARGVAVLAWIIAALNIAGLLTPVINLLDAMALPIGTFRISLLLLLKGAITLAILLWIANTLSRVADQRLSAIGPLTPAVQVLAAKLVRMVLLTLAVVLALGAIGIDLTAFAVFSGAIGVGVGFGLQKVVSNLVSGVILLLDRSIKPGDVIEVEGTLGWVSTLNARYTSVQTRDGKEYLIPNEDLITHRVTNLTYSDRLVRLRVKFGISYQSDPNEAIRLALTAAHDVSPVLAEPPPNCLLVNFGDSTIDLELRFWISDPGQGMASTRSQVMLRMWALFQEHGIELPSPQRDITLRNPEALAYVAKAQTLSSLSDQRN